MSTEALMKLIADRKASVSRIKTIKPNPGRNRYRILPGWRKNGDPTFYHDFGQHFIKNAAGEVKAVFICSDKTFGRPCAVCDSIGEGIRASVSDQQKKMLEDSRANARVLLNVLHLDGPTPNEPQIIELAPSAFNGKKGVGGIISLFTDWPNILDPQLGNDVIIDRAGTGKDTSYGVSAVPGKPFDVKLLEKIHDLDKFVAAEINEAAQRRALTTVAAISGLLPAPQAPADIPTTAAPVATSTMTAAPAPAPSVVVPPAAAATVVTPAAPAPAAVAPAVAATPAAGTPATGDAELDALLADLGPQ